MRNSVFSCVLFLAVCSSLSNTRAITHQDAARMATENGRVTSRRLLRTSDRNEDVLSAAEAHLAFVTGTSLLFGGGTTLHGYFADLQSCKATCDALPTGAGVCERVEPSGDPLTQRSATAAVQYRCTSQPGQDQVHRHNSKPHHPGEDHGTACHNLLHCSGHGVCRGGAGSSSGATTIRHCECNAGWHGVFCNITLDSAQVSSLEEMLGELDTQSLRDAAPFDDKEPTNTTESPLVMAARESGNANPYDGGVAALNAAVHAHLSRPSSPSLVPDITDNMTNASFVGTNCSFISCENLGVCVDGRCKCRTGFQGLFCEVESPVQTTDALPSATLSSQRPPNAEQKSVSRVLAAVDASATPKSPAVSRACAAGDCGPHGLCHDGRCFCSNNRAGSRCELMTCADNCNARGVCNSQTGVCECDDGWSGPTCGQSVCSATPERCSKCQAKCDPVHGLCAGNCQCLCATGWGGEDCSRALNS